MPRSFIMCQVDWGVSGVGKEGGRTYLSSWDVGLAVQRDVREGVLVDELNCPIEDSN